MVSSTDIVAAGTIDDEDFTGLEDVTVTKTPRFTVEVDNGAGVFVNNLTNERVTELDCIILCAVKQRTLWSKDIDDNEPKCRSREGKIGNPIEGQFPIDDFADASGKYLDDGKIECASCPFSVWHNDTPPPCRDQWVLPVVYDGGEALLTFHGKSVSPTTTYLGGYAARKVGAFSAHTTIKLEVHTKGSNKYAVPVFTKGEPTDPAMKPDFVAAARKLRAWLITPPPERQPELEAGADGEQPVIETKSNVIVDDMGEDPF